MMTYKHELSLFLSTRQDILDYEQSILKLSGQSYDLLNLIECFETGEYSQLAT